MKTWFDNKGESHEHKGTPQGGPNCEKTTKIKTTDHVTAGREKRTKASPK